MGGGSTLKPLNFNQIRKIYESVLKQNDVVYMYKNELFIIVNKNYDEHMWAYRIGEDGTLWFYNTKQEQNEISKIIKLWKSSILTKSK